MKIKQKLKNILIKAVNEIFNLSLDLKEIDIDIPKKKEHGDFSSNIAMKLASRVNVNPKELGDKIKNNIINQYDFIDNIAIMGPGFINFYIKEQNLIKDNLRFIENEEFKKFDACGKDIKVAVVFNKLSDIMKLQNFRAFMNMYYLGNLYSFAGYNAEKLVLVKENDINLDIKYFLSNFKNVEIILDENQLRDSNIFCSTLDQKIFKGFKQKRFIVEDVNIYKNGHEVKNITLNELFENIGIDRIKYTLSNKAINKKIDIELIKNDLRYIQYPYSRIASIINIFKNEGIDIEDIEAFDESLLTDSLDKEIIKKIMKFKDVIMNSINENQPYKFIKYANELCEIFYKINSVTLFRELSKERTVALLKLLSNVKIVLKEILNILELPIYEKM